MGFLVPLGISLGTSIGSSLLGNLFAPKPTAAQNTATAGLQTAQSTGLSNAQSLFGQGSQAVAQPLNYYAGILSGNRSQLASTLAPEVSQIGAGFGQAQRTSAALMPRGGPSAEFNAELPYQQQAAVSNLFQTARPQAAAAQASLGTNLLAQGANQLSTSTSAGRDVLNAQQQQNELQAQQANKIGSGLFSMIQTYGFPALAKQFPSLFGSLAKSDVNSSSPSPLFSNGGAPQGV